MCGVTHRMVVAVLVNVRTLCCLELIRSRRNSGLVLLKPILSCSVLPLLTCLLVVWMVGRIESRGVCLAVDTSVFGFAVCYGLNWHAIAGSFGCSDCLLSFGYSHSLHRILVL